MTKDKRLDEILRLMDLVFNDSALSSVDRLNIMELVENRAADNAICLEDEIAEHEHEETEEDWDVEEDRSEPLEEVGGEN